MPVVERLVRQSPKGLCVVNIYEAGTFEGRVEQWPVLAISGALEVRLAETDAEVEQAQRLRYAVFYQEMSAIPSPRMREAERDFDKYDEVCDHLLVVDREAHGEDGQPLVVGTYRLTLLKPTRCGRADFIPPANMISGRMLKAASRRAPRAAGAGPVLCAESLSHPPRGLPCFVERPDGLCARASTPSI